MVGTHALSTRGRSPSTANGRPNLRSRSRASASTVAGTGGGGGGRNASTASPTITTTTTATKKPAVSAATNYRAPAAKAKMTAPLRGQWAQQAVSPQLRGKRAAAWLPMWDSGSTVRRVGLLEALKTLHADNNITAVEDDLGDAAPLFFARLTSWWKLRYATWAAEAAVAAKAADATAGDTAVTQAMLTNSAGAPSSSSGEKGGGDASPFLSELLAQVEAITIFVRGSRYLLQFVEGGGAATLCDCLDVTSAIPRRQRVGNSSHTNNTHSSGSSGDAHARERRALTLLLLHIANSGRVYREMVGDADGLLHLLHALQRETDTSVALPITDLLALLGKGHPRLSSSVQTGLLRVLESALPPPELTSPTAHAVTSAAGGDTDGAAEEVVVVLNTSRVIRALQLQAEQQHYAQYAAYFSNAGSNNKHNNISGLGNAGGLSAGSGGGSGAAAGLIDYVPIVGLDSVGMTTSYATMQGMTNTTPAHTTATTVMDSLLRPFTTSDYLDMLFRLALDEHHTAYRVEGNELLNLAAKNIQLTPRILTRCLDVVDDDAYVIEQGEVEDAGIAQQRLRRQRRQLSCGRAAALILISRPMTGERRDLLLQLLAQRGGHLTLLKYLRLTQHGDTAAVVDCCHAIQFVVRASAEMQRRRMGQAATAFTTTTATAGVAGNDGGKASGAVFLRMTEGIQTALGETVFQLLLFQDLSEEDCMVILRSARAAVMGQHE